MEASVGRPDLSSPKGAGVGSSIDRSRSSFWVRACKLLRSHSANSPRIVELSRPPKDGTSNMDEIDAHRRRFLAAAGMVAAAAQFGMSARAQAAETAPSAAKPGMEASFGPLKQIDAGVLNVAYAEAGPVNGPAGKRVSTNRHGVTPLSRSGVWATAGTIST